jgi:ABC-type multidrug transport system permease subunit
MKGLNIKKSTYSLLWSILATVVVVGYIYSAYGFYQEGNNFRLIMRIVMACVFAFSGIYRFRKYQKQRKIESGVELAEEM